VWFGKDNLQPGDGWMEIPEEAISHASAMIVYIGSLGIRSCQPESQKFPSP
jgi:hypothetical protein